jgi:hypothetical protein
LDNKVARAVQPDALAIKGKAGELLPKVFAFET